MEKSNIFSLQGEHRDFYKYVFLTLRVVHTYMVCSICQALIALPKGSFAPHTVALYRRKRTMSLIHSPTHATRVEQLEFGCFH